MFAWLVLQWKGGKYVRVGGKNALLGLQHLRLGILREFGPEPLGIQQSSSSSENVKFSEFKSHVLWFLSFF